MKLHSFLIDILKQHDDYIDIHQITAALFSTQLDKMVDAYMLFFSCRIFFKLSSVELNNLKVRLIFLSFSVSLAVCYA